MHRVSGVVCIVEVLVVARFYLTLACSLRMHSQVATQDYKDIKLTEVKNTCQPEIYC